MRSFPEPSLLRLAASKEVYISFDMGVASRGMLKAERRKRKTPPDDLLKSLCGPCAAWSRLETLVKAIGQLQRRRCTDRVRMRKYSYGGEEMCHDERFSGLGVAPYKNCFRGEWCPRRGEEGASA